MGWLGASPDARVTDPYSDLPEGIAEFKCPFSKKDLTPIEACEDPSFYCHYEDGFYLKRNHPYYHYNYLLEWTNTVGVTLSCTLQKELQLKEFGWCKCSITELDSYYEAYILPEILSPLYKPSHVL